MMQQIQYCTTDDGVRLAYSVIGKGSPIVRASHWLSHLEYDLDSPIWRHLTLGMARRHAYIRYDARGTGLSQREISDKEMSLERWVTDLETIIDTLGYERVTLLGLSQGAAISIAYAARHPDRVDRMILYGGYARGGLRRGSEEAEKFVALRRQMIRAGWGSDLDAYREWFASFFIPGGTREQSKWFSDLERITASPEIADRFVVALAEIDVEPYLSQIKTPTLVLHVRGDLVTRMENSQELAAKIPGAKFVSLEGKNHLFLADEPAHRAFFEAVDAFLGDPPRKGDLVGIARPREKVDIAVRRVEQHWLTKVIIILAAVLGVGIFIADLLRR